MELQLSDEYEELAIEWQYRMITMLKETLTKYEIADDKAKEIVGEYVFDVAMLHDQEEIKLNGNRIILESVSMISGTF